MYIYQTINATDFVQAFDDMNRSENFSREARVNLFEYLDELARDTGEPIELDVIALCCEFSELTFDEAIAQAADVVGYAPTTNDIDEFIDLLRDHATVIINDHEETITISEF